MGKAFKKFPGNPRKITPEAQALLGESMAEYGSLDGFVVNVAPGKYERAIISGNQKNEHADLNKSKIEILERFDTPTEAGTTAIGFVVFKGERFPYREVFWDERKCEVANLRANNFGGENDRELLLAFDSEVLVLGGVDLAFEDFRLTFGQTGEAEPQDFSDKNKEVNVGEFEDLMVISLKYPSEEYWKVREQLQAIGQTPEAAVWKLLGNE